MDEREEMRRVLVIGCPGSGKSTFARRLSLKTGLPLVYLDMLFHLPDRTTRPVEEFDALLRDRMEGERWIIDGNYSRTLAWRLSKCDSVFLLDYPLAVCMSGAESRIGKQREDLPWTEETFDPEFRSYIEGFHEQELPKIYRRLEEYGKGKKIVIFHTREQSEKYLATLSSLHV